MFRTIFKTKVSYLLAIYYFILLLWWVKIFLSGSKEGNENNYFGLAYAFIGLIGGTYGFLVSRRWGGMKSIVGRGIIFMSGGLLLECFGQFVWSYYNIFSKVEVPFPSIADVGYFLMIPVYTIGVLLFAESAGAKYALRALKLPQVLVSLTVPLLMILITDLLLLRNVTPDFSNTINSIKTFLSFYSPLGEAVTISIAIMGYFLSLKYLGGRMKSRILYILFAVIFEFITGMTFLYQAGNGTYYNAGINDLMFTTSFTIMALGLLSFNSFEE